MTGESGTGRPATGRGGMHPNHETRGIPPARLASAALVAGIVACAFDHPAIAIAALTVAAFFSGFSVHQTFRRQQDDACSLRLSTPSIIGNLAGSTGFFAGLWFVAGDLLTLKSGSLSTTGFLATDTVLRDCAVAAFAVSWGAWTCTAHFLARDQRRCRSTGT